MTPSQRRLPLLCERVAILSKGKEEGIQQWLGKPKCVCDGSLIFCCFFKSTVHKILSNHRTSQMYYIILYAKLVKISLSIYSFIYNVFQIGRQVWAACAVLQQRDKFCSSYERPVQVTDASLPGILLQKGLHQTQAQMGSVTNLKDYEVLSGVMRN